MKPIRKDLVEALIDFAPTEEARRMGFAEYQLEGDDGDHAALGYKMNGLAILMKRMGRLEEAEELYRGAIEHHYLVEDQQQPHMVAVWEFNLGKLLVDRGRDEEAREILLQSLATHREFDSDNRFNARAR